MWALAETDVSLIIWQTNKLLVILSQSISSSPASSFPSLLADCWITELFSLVACVWVYWSCWHLKYLCEVDSGGGWGGSSSELKVELMPEGCPPANLLLTCPCFPNNTHTHTQHEIANQNSVRWGNKKKKQQSETLISPKNPIPFLGNSVKISLYWIFTYSSYLQKSVA